MGKKRWFILIAILLLGLVIRVYKIASLPLYGDELTMVYDTFSISKTGMDSTGQRFPLTFKMGAGRPGGYIYFSLPFVAVFGPTVWGERALSVISGLGIIILMYFLGRKLFNEKVGIIASLLMAISPWDIYLSRGGFEAHFALFLAVFGLTMFYYKRYVWWAIAWGLTFFTYPTFKLTIPLMFLLVVFIQGFAGLVKEKKFIAGTIVIFLFGIAAASQTFIAGSENRFLSENIFSDKMLRRDIITVLNQERSTSTLPDFLKPLVINKPIAYGRIFIDNYVANISPDFLILRGDGNPRNNPGEMGMIYFVELPLIAISLFLLWRKNKKALALLAVWILITPLATAFMGGPHGLRNGLMLPPLVLLSAYAISCASKKQSIAISILITVQFLYILIRVYTIAPAKFGSFWSAEAKKVAEEAIETARKGEKVTLHISKVDNIEYAYEVYAKVDPREVIAQYEKLPKFFGGVTIDK